MKTLDDVELADLLPQNLLKDDSVAASAQAIDGQLRVVSGMVDIPSIYVSIDRLTGAQLDHLAVGWDASVWRDTWPVALKRSVIKNVILEKRRRGTLAAVRDALQSISSAASIVEWWQTEPRGVPHTFTIYATQSRIDGVIDAELQEDLIALINDAKPLRSHYEFVVQQQAKTTLGMYGCIRSMTYSSIRTDSIVEEEAEGAIGLMAAARPISRRFIVGSAD